MKNLILNKILLRIINFFNPNLVISPKIVKRKVTKDQSKDNETVGENSLFNSIGNIYPTEERTPSMNKEQLMKDERIFINPNVDNTPKIESPKVEKREWNIDSPRTSLFDSQSSPRNIIDSPKVELREWNIIDSPRSTIDSPRSTVDSQSQSSPTGEKREWHIIDPPRNIIDSPKVEHRELNILDSQSREVDTIEDIPKVSLPGMVSLPRLEDVSLPNIQDSNNVTENVQDWIMQSTNQEEENSNSRSDGLVDHAEESLSDEHQGNGEMKNIMSSINDLFSTFNYPPSVSKENVFTPLFDDELSE